MCVYFKARPWICHTGNKLQLPACPQLYFDRLMDGSLNEHVYKSATKSQKGSTDDLVSGNKSCSSPERHCRAQNVELKKENPGAICVILSSSEQ